MSYPTSRELGQNTAGGNDGSLKGELSVGPVSYTHLDVYKRQI